MREYLLIIFFIVCIVAFKAKAQCPTPITVSVQTTPSTCSLCCDGSATVIPTGGCAVYTYSWSPGGIGIPENNGMCAGTYTVTVCDAGCCPPVSQSFFIMQSGITTIKELKSENGFIIYPNPNRGVFYINSSFKKKNIKIYNSLGQQVEFTCTDVDNLLLINVDTIESGVYVLESNKNGNLFRNKIIIE